MKLPLPFFCGVMAYCVVMLATNLSAAPARKTVVSLQGQAFCINGRPTYAGQSFRGSKIEGLLFNARMVQGTFDDLNEQSRSMWNYAGGPWDPDRNTREFIAAMPTWREHGLLAFTLNFQGGSPQGYSKSQPWINSAFDNDGNLRPAYLERLARIIDRADELGMVVILGYFYQAQEKHMTGEEAIIRATDNATDWILEQGYTNVLVEVANEADNGGFKHDIIRPTRAPELIRRVQERSAKKVASSAGRLLVSTSLNGGRVPPAPLVAAEDFILMHGNGVKEPKKIGDMVDACRKLPTYRDHPILFNEDDHFDFDQPDNNMLAALRHYASWGYFDYRMKGEKFEDGYQSVPVSWKIDSPRKRGFFGLLKEVTSSKPAGKWVE